MGLQVQIDSVRDGADLARDFRIAAAVDASSVNIMGLPMGAAMPGTIGDLRGRIGHMCWWPLQGLLLRGTVINPGACWLNVGSCPGHTTPQHPDVFGATAQYNAATAEYTFVANTQLDMVVSLDLLLPNWAVKVGECTVQAAAGDGVANVSGHCQSVVALH
jgi:hypothetical protein